MCKSHISAGWMNIWAGSLKLHHDQQFNILLKTSRVYCSKRRDQANNHSKQIYTWLYPQVYYLFIVSSYFITPCKASNNTNHKSQVSKYKLTFITWASSESAESSGIIMIENALEGFLNTVSHGLLYSCPLCVILVYWFKNNIPKMHQPVCRFGLYRFMWDAFEFGVGFHCFSWLTGNMSKISYRCWLLCTFKNKSYHY